LLVQSIDTASTIASGRDSEVIPKEVNVNTVSRARVCQPHQDILQAEDIEEEEDEEGWNGFADDINDHHIEHDATSSSLTTDHLPDMEDDNHGRLDDDTSGELKMKASISDFSVLDSYQAADGMEDKESTGCAVEDLDAEAGSVGLDPLAEHQDSEDEEPSLLLMVWRISRWRLAVRSRILQKDIKH